MSGATRVGDSGTGVCPCHTSPVVANVTITSGYDTVTANGIPVAIIGSSGISSCGHATIAIGGSSIVIASAGIHRLGDGGQVCGGNYTMVAGSADVIVG